MIISTEGQSRYLGKKDVPAPFVATMDYVTTVPELRNPDVLHFTDKDYILQSNENRIDAMAESWMREQNLVAPRTIDLMASDCPDVLATIAEIWSVRIAFYIGVWELVNSVELIVCGGFERFQPNLEYKMRGFSGGLDIRTIGCAYPERIEKMPTDRNQSVDVDIFLKGIDCRNLHPGILEAIEQSLLSFRRGLYMPAVVMLAAGTEATWIECGIAVAKKLSNAKLDTTVNNPFTSISKKVAEIRKALEAMDGKALLKSAGENSVKVTEAEQWTTILRDRRNALHWGKAKSFIMDHSDAASLLMGAPLHIGTLEAIRAAC